MSTGSHRWVGRLAASVVAVAALVASVGCEARTSEYSEYDSATLLQMIETHVEVTTKDLHEQEREKRTQLARHENGKLGWPPDQEAIVRLRGEIAALEAAKDQSRETAQALLVELLSRQPESSVGQRAEDLVLGSECRAVLELSRERDRIAEALEEPPDVSGERGYDVAFTLRRLDRDTLDALDREIAIRHTRLCDRFSGTQRVKELDRELVWPRFQQLSANLQELTAAAPAGEVALSDQDRANLLAELAEIKRRFPRSDWTRRAEERVIPLTAKKTLADLWGWPVVLFLFFGVLLLFEIGRCIGAFRRRQPTVEQHLVLRPSGESAGAAVASSSDDSVDAVPRAGAHPVPTPDRVSTSTSTPRALPPARVPLPDLPVRSAPKKPDETAPEPRSSP